MCVQYVNMCVQGTNKNNLTTFEYLYFDLKSGWISNKATKH